MVEAAFDGASRYAGCFGDFGLFHTFEVPELDNFTVVLRQLIEGTLEIGAKDPLAFGSLLYLFRKVLGGSKLRRGPVTRTPGSIARQVRGDGENPRLEPSRGIEA